MAQLFIFVICFMIALPLAILWVRGIDYMKQNHSDYKGEDFLESEKDNSSNWDTEPSHYEGEF